MKRFSVVVLAGITIAALLTSARATDSHRDTPLVIRAMSSDPQVADSAIARLRQRGQRGVDLMIAGAPQRTDSSVYRAALDRVCRQKDCVASHLYWYTSLDEAKAAAKATAKPILALHLLGNLDEELSCANSRFFRTTLYSNPKIAGFMREHFVLYWKSVRPVPKITVEFGDGRRLVQTITGNSIHYLLDADGTPLEALPGLYSPADFLSKLEAMNELGSKYASTAAPQRLAFLRAYHSEAWRKTATELGNDLWRTRLSDGSRETPTAAQASRLTESKSGGEAPLLNAFNLYRQPITDVEWKRFAEHHAKKQPVEFDPASVALMREKVSRPESLEKMLTNLQQSVAEDTLRNEYDLHMKIHEWMMSFPAQSLDTLNERVYATLFLTPGNDPWLGLLQDDRFIAIPDSGAQVSR